MSSCYVVLVVGSGGEPSWAYLGFAGTAFCEYPPPVVVWLSLLLLCDPGQFDVGLQLGAQIGEI